jgi:hypothetical protein
MELSQEMLRTAIMQRYQRSGVTLLLAIVVLACPCLCLGGANGPSRAEAKATCCRHCSHERVPAENAPPADRPDNESGSCLCNGALHQCGEQLDLTERSGWTPIHAEVVLQLPYVPHCSMRGRWRPQLGPPDNVCAGRALRVALESLTI